MATCSQFVIPSAQVGISTDGEDLITNYANERESLLEKRELLAQRAAIFVTTSGGVYHET
ncbi:MAG TPA: hypothetical protein VJW73_17030 [Gemmatimonadaceae bacterium]|nr:hypothetical protein [Gemmatimonadaceae bacterium]